MSSGGSAPTPMKMANGDPAPEFAVREAIRLDLAKRLIATLEAANLDDVATAAPLDRAELARQARAKLQYDFPLMRAEELDALTAELLSEDGEVGGGGDRRGGVRAAVTSRLVSAAIEGASRPAPWGSSGAPTIESATAAAAAEGDDDARGDEEKARDRDRDRYRDRDAADDAAATDVRAAYQRLCAALLIHLPLRVARMEDADADALLGGYVRELDPVAETTNDDAADDADDADDDAATTAAPAAAPPNDDADLDPGSDSEEWEPLERDPSTAPSARAPTPPDADAAMTPGDRVDAKLLDLLSRTSSACFSDGGENARFTAVSTSSSSASSVWDDPTTTTACVELIETLARASARPRRRACRLLPLRTLRDRWATRGPPGERDRETRDALPRVLAALGFR